MKTEEIENKTKNKTRKKTNRKKTFAADEQDLATKGADIVSLSWQVTYIGASITQTPGIKWALEHPPWGPLNTDLTVLVNRQLKQLRRQSHENVIQKTNFTFLNLLRYYPN